MHIERVRFRMEPDSFCFNTNRPIGFGQKTQRGATAVEPRCDARRTTVRHETKHGAFLVAPIRTSVNELNFRIAMLTFTRINFLRFVYSIACMKTRAEQFLLGLSVTSSVGADIFVQRQLRFSALVLHQNSAFFGVRGKGMTSRMFCMPVTKRIRRSKPNPKPACGQLP